MRRRHWLKLGLGATTVLAVAGGAVALVEPGLRAGRLSVAGQGVFGAVGRAMLDGSLPTDPLQRSQALQAFLLRVDALAAALPGHAQQELSQLLALLATSAGRRVLAGLDVPWSDADVSHVQAALQSMRTSPLSLQQQAYHALHDITSAAYFSDPSTWGVLGYPGPMAI